MNEQLLKEVDLFFEIEKRDGIEEFKINFQSFILDYEEIQDIAYYLLKLFSNEKKELESQKESTPERFLIGHRINIKKIKKIINYLKQIIELEDKKKSIKNVSNRKKEKVIISEKKKKKPTKKTQKNIFSDEIILLAKNIEQNLITKNELTNIEINQLIKYYRVQAEKLIQKKIELRNIKNEVSLEETQIQQKKVNRILKELLLYRNDLEDISIIKKSNEKSFRLPISNDQLLNLNPKLYQLIEKISENEFQNINYIQDIFEICEKQYILERENILEELRKKTIVLGDCNFEDLNEEEKKLVLKYDNNIEKANIHMNILNNLINYLKYYYKKIMKSSSICSNQFEEEYVLSDTQEQIKENLFMDNLFESYNIDDILLAFSKYLKYETLQNQKEILSLTKSIFVSLESEKMNKNLLEGVFYILDAIKYRLSHEEKEHKEERKLLKEIRTHFEFITKNTKNEEPINDPLFDVATYFMEYENGYLYLKRLTEELPKIVNSGHIIVKNGCKRQEHIVIFIVKEFIKNYQKMIDDNKSEYINKDYLKSIYFLFVRNYALTLTEEEKQEIDNLLRNFIYHVTTTLTSSKRKNVVKEDIKRMYTDKFYMNEDYSKEINENVLENQMNSMEYYMKSMINKNSIDLTNEKTIKFLNYYNAYSIEETESMTKLKIHVIDLYHYIPGYTTLDDYFYNMTISHEKIDDFISRKAHMSLGNEYPAITYEIGFSKNGEFQNERGNVQYFNVYSSKITIDKRLGHTDFYYHKDDEDLKQYLELYKNVFIKNGGNYTNTFNLSDIEDYFEEILNQGVLELLKKRNLPVVYSGIEKTRSEESIHIMNHLSSILSNVSRDDFEIIYQIINSDIDEFHYSLDELTYQPTYEWYVMNPLNYIGLSMQRMLHEFILNNKFTEAEYNREVEKYRKKLENLVAVLNYNNHYVDKDILRTNKGRLVKTKKILF